MYRLELSHNASWQILRLPVETRERVNRAITQLGENPRHNGSKKLTDREGYRARIGDYRILYVIDDRSKVVTVYRVKGRGEVYRG